MRSRSSISATGVGYLVPSSLTYVPSSWYLLFFSRSQASVLMVRGPVLTLCSRLRYMPVGSCPSGLFSVGFLLPSFFPAIMVLSSYIWNAAMIAHI